MQDPSQSNERHSLELFSLERLSLGLPSHHVVGTVPEDCAAAEQMRFERLRPDFQ